MKKTSRRKRLYGCPGCGELIGYGQVSCDKCAAQIEWVKIPQLVAMSDESRLRIEAYNNCKKNQQGEAWHDK